MPLLSPIRKMFFWMKTIFFVHCEKKMKGNESSSTFDQVGFWTIVADWDILQLNKPITYWALTFPSPDTRTDKMGTGCGWLLTTSVFLRRGLLQWIRQGCHFRFWLCSGGRGREIWWGRKGSDAEACSWTCVVYNYSSKRICCVLYILEWDLYLIYCAICHKMYSNVIKTGHHHCIVETLFVVNFLKQRI